MIKFEVIADREIDDVDRQVENEIDDLLCLEEASEIIGVDFLVDNDKVHSYRAIIKYKPMERKSIF